MVDLALNAIAIIDRNLYERICDVRRWATDSAMVDCTAMPTPESVAHATKRLGVILDAYTVYLDLWLCDLSGRVIANGRPDRYPAVGIDVSSEPWFARAKRLASGDDYAVADITECAGLKGAQVATYAASVRRGGESHGAPLGVLAIHFDWELQAATIVRGSGSGSMSAIARRCCWSMPKAASSPRPRTIKDCKSTLRSRRRTRASGFYARGDGTTVAFHATPGYETYRGLGWHGVIFRRAAATSDRRY